MSIFPVCVGEKLNRNFFFSLLSPQPRPSQPRRHEDDEDSEDATCLCLCVRQTPRLSFCNPPSPLILNYFLDDITPDNITLTHTDNDNSEEVQLIFALNMLDLINADGCWLFLSFFSPSTIPKFLHRQPRGRAKQRDSIFPQGLHRSSTIFGILPRALCCPPVSVAPKSLLSLLLFT